MQGLGSCGSPTSGTAGPRAWHSPGSVPAQPQSRTSSEPFRGSQPMAQAQPEHKPFPNRFQTKPDQSHSHVPMTKLSAKSWACLPHAGRWERGNIWDISEQATSTWTPSSSSPLRAVLWILLLILFLFLNIGYGFLDIIWIINIWIFFIYYLTVFINILIILKIYLLFYTLDIYSQKLS